MKKEELSKEERDVREEIRLAMNDYFIGSTKKTEDGFILDLGRAGAFEIRVTRV